jgi:arylsulfatase A-like enzyme
MKEIRRISRRKALKQIGLISAMTSLPQIVKGNPLVKVNAHRIIKPAPGMSNPNIVIIMCDQVRADVCRHEGFALDTTPFLTSLAQEGIWFNRAYTTAPASVPARTSLFSGRFPTATRVRSNHNIEDAVYSKDLIDVVRESGYRTALIGKNHSYLKPDRFDYWKEYGHLGVPHPANDREKAFNTYLRSTNFYADLNPSPFSAEMQHPERIVGDAQHWISSIGPGGQPFFLFMSFPEPHSPYQVSEPYYSMFPPETLPPLITDGTARSLKGKKFELQAELLNKVKPGFEKNIPRIRSNYFGMLRLIDDSIKRFIEYIETKNLAENTILLFISDHGDFVGEYGLTLKGVGVPECLARVPMIWKGPGIGKLSEPHNAHISLADIFPTICDLLDVPLPDGVQGRSIWPLLNGASYPAEEFSSVLVQQGFGGLDYTSLDQLDPYLEGCIVRGSDKFDELNSWSQSGILRMVRKDDWKLVYDMQGTGQLYNLSEDPAEIRNLFNYKEYQQQQMELMQDMMAWELRIQDPLPLPRRRYIYRRDPRNYWSPYRSQV